jgi:predicted nucleotidyltransferase
VSSSSQARAVADRLVPRLAGEGARAVALVGSHARGVAGIDSDLDLAVVGEGPHYRLEVIDGVLVSLGWAPEDAQRRRLYDPEYLGTHVPGWREAVVLHDPDGVTDSIKREALEWSWDTVEHELGVWVPESITGHAEEAQKLSASIHTGHESTAAVQRSILVLRLPAILALHLRILYGSENELWNRVAEALGPVWRDAQSAALGLGGESLDASCHAALRLFALATDEVGALLDERQRAVVEHVLRHVDD